MIYFCPLGRMVSDEGPGELEQFAKELGLTTRERKAGPFPHYFLNSKALMDKARERGAVITTSVRAKKMGT